jgi:hypothetical protein
MSDASKAVVLLRDRDRLAWRVNAGLRLLSALEPQYAEAKWLGSRIEREEVSERRRVGVLTPVDSYNVLTREPTGEVKYVTYYDDGGGRTWDGGFGDAEAAFPTIELDLSQAAGSTSIADATLAAARETSKALGDQTVEKITRLRGTRATQISASELSVFHSGAQTPFKNAFDKGEASFLIEFLDDAFLYLARHDYAVSALAAYLDGYEKHVLAGYRAKTEPGVEVSLGILMIAIARAASPVWPFSSGPWSCGVLGCAHRLCAASAASASTLPAWEFGLAFRNAFASALKSKISLQRLLLSVASAENGALWIECAARSLTKRAEELRGSLQSEKSFDRFYSIHHEIVPVVFAALRTYRFLASALGKSEFVTEANACEEIKARSLTALIADFDGSCAPEPFLRDRNMLEEVRHMGGDDAAEARLRKWLFDEALFPAGFESFLSGATDVLEIDSPFPGDAVGAKLRHRILTAIQRPRRYGS